MHIYVVEFQYPNLKPKNIPLTVTTLPIQVITDLHTTNSQLVRKATYTLLSELARVVPAAVSQPLYTVVINVS